MLEWVTPQLFDTLIIGNMLLGVGLIVWRFGGDMRRPLSAREQLLEELEADTHPPHDFSEFESEFEAVDDPETQERASNHD